MARIVRRHAFARVFRLVLLDGERPAGEPFDLSQLVAFFAAAERRGDAGRAGPACAADAVDVNLRHLGQLVVDDVRDAVDIQPAGGDVGGHEHGRPVRLEGIQRALPHVLAFVAVDRRGANAGADQVFHDFVGPVLGAGEYERSREGRVLQEVREQVRLVPRLDEVHATVASALVIGAVNITLLITIAVLAGTHADPARLAQLDPPTLDGNALGLVFGVVLGAYFGHTSAGNAAKVVLAREPTGRALVRGNVAAMASAIVLYVAIVGAVNSAVPAEALRSFNGAAITPLAEVVGPSVTVLGTIFIFLAIGLATVIFSLGLFNQTIELAGDAASQSVTIRRLLASRWPRFALAAAPVAGTFLIALFLLASGQGSFAGPLAIVGTLAMPLLAGMLPMLLLLAARRRGEYVPGFAPRFLGHPVTIVAVASLYLAGVLAHAFVIWEEPISRALALATTAITLATAVAAARQGSFRPRAVLELREAGTRRRPSVQLVSGGRLVAIEGSTTEAPFAERVFGIPSLDVTELTVWAHHATDQGESNPIMGVVEILGSDGSLVTRVAAPDGTATVPISPGGAFGIQFVPGDPTALMSSDATLPTKSRVPSGPVMGLT